MNKLSLMLALVSALSLLVGCNGRMPTDPIVYVDDSFSAEELEQVDMGMHMWEPSFHMHRQVMPHVWVVDAVERADRDGEIVLVKDNYIACEQMTRDSNPSPHEVIGSTHRRGTSGNSCIDPEEAKKWGTTLSLAVAHEMGHAMGLANHSDQDGEFHEEGPAIMSVVAAASGLTSVTCIDRRYAHFIFEEEVPITEDCQ